MNSKELALFLRQLNAVDVALTLYTVLVRGAEEMNPINAALLELSPPVFIVLKMIFVSWLSVILAKYNQRAALIALILAYVGALLAHAACF